MNDEKRWVAYQECKRRGHEKGDMLMSEPPWHRCKWCGTRFRFVLVEADPPTDPEENTE